MKKIAAILGLGLLILSFQNCSSPELVAQGQDEREVIYDKIKAVPVTDIVFWDESRGLRLDVNLSTGVMTAFEEMGQVRGETYCLPENAKLTLNEILADANICLPEPTAIPEVCAQVYHAAYASLTIGTKSYNLDERLDSCTPAVDLCDPQAQVLKAFVQNTLLQLERYTCN
jgi:hypothetical protein